MGLIFDGFDLIVNGCATNTISIYEDKEGYQLTVLDEGEEICMIITRDELVELKTLISVLLDTTAD
jgi:hypothetical protein